MTNSLFRVEHSYTILEITNIGIREVQIIAERNTYSVRESVGYATPGKKKIRIRRKRK